MGKPLLRPTPFKFLYSSHLLLYAGKCYTRKGYEKIQKESSVIMGALKNPLEIIL